MPSPLNTENKYDFEELFFEKNCNIDEIIASFFFTYKDVIKGDVEYISYKIKELVTNDKNALMKNKNENNNSYNIVGKNSLIKHYVIPLQNNLREYYIYSIHSFI
jgi:hypothetical protein